MVVTANNLAERGDDTASCSFVGIATNTVISAPAGTKINVKYGHEELFATNVSLAALTGNVCVIEDSDGVTSVADGTNDCKVGEIVEVVSTTRAWVKVRSTATT